MFAKWAYDMLKGGVTSVEDATGRVAGQIRDAVVVCGNLIERFDHARAVRVLAGALRIAPGDAALLFRLFFTGPVRAHRLKPA